MFHFRQNVHPTPHSMALSPPALDNHHPKSRIYLPSLALYKVLWHLCIFLKCVVLHFSWFQLFRLYHAVYHLIEGHTIILSSFIHIGTSHCSSFILTTIRYSFILAYHYSFISFSTNELFSAFTFVNSSSMKYLYVQKKFSCDYKCQVKIRFQISEIMPNCYQKLL